MRTVITYGTFDLLHEGHINLLRRAKELGDKLIVGVTSESYDLERGKLNVRQTLSERISGVMATKLVDQIIVEEQIGQKIEDIKKYNVDVFVIGSDWQDKFDYLKPYCEVIYLPRTSGISSTQIRNKRIIRLGIAGNGNIASRFINECKFVSGVEIVCVYGRNKDKLKDFCNKFLIKEFSLEYDKFLQELDAVYIATPQTTHFEYIKRALLAGKHVLCEKPLVLDPDQAKFLFELAESKRLVLFEAIKTAYTPAFSKLVNLALSGVIGSIVEVDLTFTKLLKDDGKREFTKEGGAFHELSSYSLILTAKLLGTNPKNINFYCLKSKDQQVDVYTKLILDYGVSIGTTNVGISAKKEGDGVIVGTEGYLYIPAPWWKTSYFELRGDDGHAVSRYFYKFAGDGLRYELACFVKTIQNGLNFRKISPQESIFLARLQSLFEKKFK